MATDENSTPRHGRHAAARKHDEPTPKPELTEVESVAPSPAAASEPLQDISSAPVAPIAEGDQELEMGNAPTPVGVDPAETGSFTRISAGEGARVTTRANVGDTSAFRAQGTRPIEAVRMSTAGRPKVERHEQEVESNGRVFLMLGLGALLVLMLGGWLLARALVSVDNGATEEKVEQKQVTPDESIEYYGVRYALEQNADGVYVLTSTPADEESEEGPTTVCQFKGKPVSLILYNSVFVIPENLPDGTWDLITHPLGGGSVTRQIPDQDGNPLIGPGEIYEAILINDSIQISTMTGETYTVSLE